MASVAAGADDPKRPPAPPSSAGPGDGRRDRAVKLMRRIMGLTAGRWEFVVTVDDHGVTDWSLRSFGKVER